MFPVRPRGGAVVSRRASSKVKKALSHTLTPNCCSLGLTPLLSAVWPHQLWPVYTRLWLHFLGGFHTTEGLLEAEIREEFHFLSQKCSTFLFFFIVTVSLKKNSLYLTWILKTWLFNLEKDMFLLTICAFLTLYSRTKIPLFVLGKKSWPSIIHLEKN